MIKAIGTYEELKENEHLIQIIKLNKGNRKETLDDVDDVLNEELKESELAIDEVVN